jgi:succinate-acetate transporter protein
MNAMFPDAARFEPVAVRPFRTGGPVAVVLRVEALVELVLAVSAYRAFGGGWLMFAALVLLPDLGIAGYLMNRRVGAAVYNLAHTYSAPALLALAGLMLSTSALYLPALIWAAHIGFDRVLGYGLKYPVAFGATHLGWTGAPAAFAEQPSEVPLFN